MSTPLNYLRNKTFAVYGLGVTGRSVINYFNKNGFKKYIVWDDDHKILKKTTGEKFNIIRKKFLKLVNFVDYIVLSPGVNIKKAKLKNTLLKNKKKIITDLDLFYFINPNLSTVMVTGTNGKSTTCKIIEHVFKKNKINTKLGGNIGSPILNLNFKKNPLVIIEASSFQLAYSSFVKPDYALLLNISKDHLDWHETMDEYIKSKLKIFSLQEKDNFAFINHIGLIKKFKKNNYKSKIKFINTNKLKILKNKLRNDYLKSDSNIKNISFVYALAKIFNINQKNFLNSVKSFKGLEHRNEIVINKKNIMIINDSKSTSFESSKSALKNNKNIYWILGGLPKKGDVFRVNNFKKNITKAYIIGENTKHFRKYIERKVSFTLSNTLKKAVHAVFKEIKNVNDTKATILFSPASASYDQFKNFEDRGNKFKSLIKPFLKRFK